jgi:hypothetical protein
MRVPAPDTAPANDSVAGVAGRLLEPVLAAGEQPEKVEKLP